MQNTKNNIDWIIHLVANGAVCECCGKVEGQLIGTEVPSLKCE